MQKNEYNIRTVRVIGEDAFEKLKCSHVAVFGVGGVGGHICEALARVGVGAIDIFDKDTVSESNINRQIVALRSTVGRPKVDVMRERILDINPDCKVTANEVFYLPENADEFDLSKYDFIADAIDTVPSKIKLIAKAYHGGVPIISAMGAGNKLYPERFKVSDLYKTDTDPLARIMRRELKKLGVNKLLVVYSDEVPTKKADIENGDNSPGSLSFVPSAMGLIMAGEIVRRIIEK